MSNTNYPGAIDTPTDPLGTNPLNSPDHALQHGFENDAIVALETKVGVDSSAVTTTIDYKLKSTSSIDPGHKHTTGSISGQIAVAQGGTGAATFTAGVLEASGTSAFTTVAAPTGTIVGTTDTQTLTNKNLTDASNTFPSSVTLPSGTVLMYGGASAPTGYLNCDGSAVSRSTYAALFTAVSTTYGAGNGTTTFNVPDMRGRIAIGIGTGTGGGASGSGLPTGGSSLTARSLGDWLGEETHALTSGEGPAHTHTVPTFQSGSGGSDQAVLQAGNNASNTVTSGSTGSGTGHNNIQPEMGLNFIIKT